MNVAIQGVKASFHDVAAHKFFTKSFAAVECNSFPLLFKNLDNGTADFAVMAIENALAGSILPNYALLEKYKFKIVGEVYLKIEMCLLALPGEKLSDIRVVQSHPMALLQCRDFLSNLKNVKVIEHADTAESAMEIKQLNLSGHAAIASELAAETFGLDVIGRNIQTDRANFTRFLILAKEENYQPNPHANKASLCFEAEHTPGSLARSLSILNKYDVNMSKIHSLPIIGRPFHFAFHVDLEWSDSQKYQEALNEFSASVVSLLHFGDYVEGEKPKL